MSYTVGQLRAAADRFAHAYGIPPAIFRSLITDESGWRTDATSPVGAKGLGQLMPSTAKSLGINTSDPIQSLRGAAMYLHQQLQHFGSIPLALAAYNAGPGAVAHFGGIPPYAETQHYVQNIMAMAKSMGGVGSSAAAEGIPPGLSSTGLTDTQAPPSMSLAPPSKSEMLQMAAPSSGDVSILQSLGGEAADAASAAQQPIVPQGEQAPTNDPGSFPMMQEVQNNLGAMPPLGQPNAQQAMPNIKIQGKVSAADRTAVQTIQEYLGTPYHWGGSNPKSGFDCSGLLQYVWGKAGVQIPRTTYQQWRVGKPVSMQGLRPGDAVFFEPSKQGPGHVGMYIGGGKFIEAPHTGADVRISKLKGYPGFVGARRFA